MSETLTDEQLSAIERQTEDVADDLGFKFAGDDRDAATAIIERALQKVFQAGRDALRAERAKATQSDEERAHHLVCEIVAGDTTDEDAVRIVESAFASIRAEGSAERAKLEAVLVETQIYSAFLPDSLNKKIYDLVALAQPAESGATFSDGCESMADLQAGAKSAESGATEAANPIGHIRKVGGRKP